jgi:hypothetical protein
MAFRLYDDIGPLLRHPVDLSAHNRGMDETEVNKVNAARDTLYRMNDHSYVMQAMVSRYAREVVRVKNEKSGTISYRNEPVETRINKARESAIRAGYYEIIRTALYNSIVTNTATLFSEPSQRYEWDTDGVGEVVTDLREQSNASLACQRWDSLAVGVNSAPLYLSVAGNILIQTEVNPTSFWVVHAQRITDQTIGRDRATNTMDLDEASVVVMQLQGKTGNKNHYAAWFGPSQEYQYGRYVQYKSSTWHEIPEPDERDENIIDYRNERNELAAPLAWWAEQEKDYSIPVYPFAICYGSPMSCGLMPVSTSMYEDCLELDLSSSLILGAAGKGARGKVVLKREEGGEPPQNWDEGLVLISRGMTLTDAGLDPAKALAALEVERKLSRAISESWNVPGYFVTPEQEAAPPTGIAIKRMAEPMLRYRRDRIVANRASVRRRFAIERALINSTRGETVIPSDTIETWYPGEREFTKDPAEETTTLDAQVKAGFISMAEAIMELKGLDTFEKLFNYLTERKRQEGKLKSGKLEGNEEEELSDLLPTAATPPQPTMGQPGAAMGGGLRAMFGAARNQNQPPQQ